jgi:parallel beta-helix repeat protein
MKRLVSGIMLTLLLTSILTLAFNIQSAKASGTIYIRADGSIDPPTAPIQRNGDIYTFTGSIYDSVVIERNSIVVDGAGHTIQGAGSGSGIGIHLYGGYNITLKNLKVKGFYFGVSLDYSAFNSIFNITVSYNNWVGIYLAHSDNNTVSENSALNNGYLGIELSFSCNNNVSHNVALYNGVDGIYLYYSAYNNISHNAASYNEECGIWLYYSDNNTLYSNGGFLDKYGIWLEQSSNNTILYNMVLEMALPSYGIVLQDFSENNNISRNEVFDCGIGMILSSSSENSVTQNSVANHNVTGIGLEDCDRCLVSNNTVQGRTDIEMYSLAGIRIGGSYNNIFGNRLQYNSAGIVVAGFDNAVFDNVITENFIGICLVAPASYNDVYDNYLFDNDYSVELEDSDHNLVADNAVSSNECGIVVVGSNHNVFSRNDIYMSPVGILLTGGGNSRNNTLINNSIEICEIGIFLTWYASESAILQNNITNNNNGIKLESASNNTLFKNNIVNNYDGIWLGFSSNNSIYNNNVINNTNQVYTYIPSIPSVNVWDDGYPSGGNCWSDYAGADANGDGIGDTPYIIDGNNTDRYPLMKLWTPHNIAVINVAPSKTVVGQGFTVHKNVTIVNRGDYTETFNVTVYANTTIIETKEITLTSGNSTTITFTWNTTGFAKGNYTISANAEPVPGEIDTTDNTLADGWVLVTIPGDVNGDFKCEGKDIAIIAKAYGTRAGEAGYVPNADINDDGKIDGKDIAIAAKYYGTHYP